jgi:YegS/Rv2252/BmrU family lipid kinase
VVYLNRSSGFDAKDSVFDKLTARCADMGVEPRIEFVEAGVDLEVRAREAVHEGADAVVAGGGDGTQRAVAAALAHTETAMGILPVGTWNHFARDLAIPLDAERATETLISGQIKPVDLGEVNGRVFINNSIIGLYPNYRFIKAREERRGRWHWLAYVWSVLKVFKRLPFYTLRFRIGDGREFVRRTPFVLIANNAHEMEGYHLGTRASLTEGQLYVYIMRPAGRWGLFRMVLNLALGRFSKRRDFEVYRAGELRIHGRQKRLGVSLDGEITILNLPLHYRSLPQALRVIVPRD